MEQDSIDIREYLSGSMTAFDRLYSRYERQLFFYILSMIRHTQTAEDIFQDVWQQAVKKLPAFKFKGQFRNWLYTIAHNKVIDHTRTRPKETILHFEDEVAGQEHLTLHEVVADPAPDIARNLDIKELYHKVQVVVETLPEEQREVFLLRCDAGMKFKEIAEMLELSINTVLSRMHYAQKRIRQELQDQYYEHENT